MSNLSNCWWKLLFSVSFILLISNSLANVSLNQLNKNTILSNETEKIIKMMT